MPSLITTIEDTSPVIIYSGSGGGDWRSGNSSSDLYADRYSQSSFTLTQKTTASLSFSFSGIGVQIFGAKRSNHGLYQISIDSTTYSPVNGTTANQPGDFQVSLFNTDSLTNGPHKVTMTNLGTSLLDVDFITWETPVGTPNEKLLSTTIQDSESSFQYISELAWNENLPSSVIGMFSGGTGHATTVPGTYADFTFSLSGRAKLMMFPSSWILTWLIGSAVALFGPVGPTGAPYSVQLDNQSPSNYSANKQFYRPQQILFQAGNLGSGNHVLRIVSMVEENTNFSLAIDFAQVFTAPSLQASAPGSRLSVGAITGITIGVIALAVAIIGIFTIFLPPKYRRIFRLQGAIEEKSIFVPDSFDYQPLSHSSDSHYNSATHSHSVTSPTYAPISPPLHGIYPSISELPVGANTQLITFPFTPDGKYRPDLTSTPRLLPPPGNRGNKSTQQRSEDSQVHLRQMRSQPQLPPGAAQPILGGGGESRSNMAVPTPLRRKTVPGSPMRKEPPLYQRR